jgi:type IV secretory pathway VirB4 component
MVVIIIELIIQKIYKLKGIRKTLIIDEALNFLQDPKMGDFIGYLYRTFRKKEGEVIIAAQNVKFLETAVPVVRDSIILNSATNILLDHSEHTSNYADIKKILSFTDHQIELLDSLEKGDTYREFLMKLGKETNIFRMQVSKFANAVYTSKESEVKEMENIMEKTGSMESAIRQFIENKNN